MLLILSAKLVREGDKRGKNESLKGVAGSGAVCYHHDCTAASVPTHPPSMRSIWTYRDTLWHETLFPLGFPESSRHKWAGKEVTQSWSPTTGNLQRIPDCQVLLDPIGRGNCSDWIQMGSSLGKAGDTELYWLGSRLNPGTGHGVDSSKSFSWEQVSLFT